MILLVVVPQMTSFFGTRLVAGGETTRRLAFASESALQLHFVGAQPSPTNIEPLVSSHVHHRLCPHRFGGTNLRARGTPSLLRPTDTDRESDMPATVTDKLMPSCIDLAITISAIEIYAMTFERPSDSRTANVNRMWYCEKAMRVTEMPDDEKVSQ